jgi:hypothetical protein
MLSMRRTRSCRTPGRIVGEENRRVELDGVDVDRAFGPGLLGERAGVAAELLAGERTFLDCIVSSLRAVRVTRMAVIGDRRPRVKP